VPPPTDCDSAANAAALSGERQSRTLLGVDTGQGKLRGEYADLASPIFGEIGVGLADEPTHVYNYACNDPRFEEANVYYHVDTMQRLVQSLGFTGGSAILDFPFPAHAHFGPGCNAFYNPSLGGYIAFLDGGMCGGLDLPADWAEEADVISHEYGHALHDAGVAGFGFSGPEAFAATEGFADFASAAYFGTVCHNEWMVAVATVLLGLDCLRNVETGAYLNLATAGYYDYYVNYPEGLDFDPHAAGMVWSGALWDIVQAFGGDEAARHKVLRLALQSHFSLTPDFTFAEAATAVRQADIDLYAGADVAAITAAFNGRRICFPEQLLNLDSGPPGPWTRTGHIGNGPGIPTDDVTVPNGDALGDNCEADTDNDNDGLPDDEDFHPYGDSTYDDDGDGDPPPGCLDSTGAVISADDGPSWDTNCDGIRDGLSAPFCNSLSSSADADGDGIPERVEVCKWGTGDSDTDSDDDGLSDCLEIVDVNGDEVADFLGDLLGYAQAALLPAAAFGKDGTFDINGDNTLDFLGDVLGAAVLILLPPPQGGCDPAP
jgi:hypothetical protein